jgi:hypothetical protein
MIEEVHLDETALGARLRAADVRAAVRRQAESIAAGVDRQGIQVGDLEAGASATVGLPVLVEEGSESPDASLGIYLAHPAGLAVEARYGALARAASEQGLRLGAKPPQGAS